MISYAKARDDLRPVPVSPDDPLPVDATVSATIGDWATANASPPTLGEGDPAPGSVDLKGFQRTIGPASPETGSVYNGNTALTPKFAKITASASGATTLVNAVTSKKIRVLGFMLSGSGAVNAKFQSHVTPTDITGLLYLGTDTVVSAPFSPSGWFETVAGEALDINLSGNVAVGGYLVYIEV